jgi:hypothetical protein
MATAINMATYAVRDAAGVVDSDATVAKFSADLDTYIAERETEETVISNAVNSVFDNYKGARMSVPFVIREALTALNVSAMPNALGPLTKRVHSYLSDNAKGDNSLFLIVKGPRGGCSRRADKATAATDSK